MRLLSLLVFLFLTACAGVKASAPAELSCPPVQLQLGDDGKSASLKLQYGPCSLSGDGQVNGGGSYRLKTAMDVCEAQSWLGTLTDSRIEVGIEWLFFDSSGAFLFSVPNQYDKHQDVVGSHWSNTVNLRANGACRHLDSGTTIEVQEADGIIECPHGCGTHSILYVTGVK